VLRPFPLYRGGRGAYELRLVADVLNKPVRSVTGDRLRLTDVAFSTADGWVVKAVDTRSTRTSSVRHASAAHRPGRTRVEAP
jgi:hypothetical protein